MPFEDGGMTPYVPASSGTPTEFPFQGFHPSSMLDASNESKDAATATAADICGNAKLDDEKTSKTKLTMWQLSFSDFSEEEGARLRTASPEELLSEALRRCKGWFEPVCDMINCTPKKEVWGTGLYDRDPMPLRGKDQGSRVTVIGDACHPMSMFKGQGANQALHDGPLLASWLDCGSGATAKKNSKPHNNIFDAHKVVDNNLNDQNVYTRLRCFEREMVARTSSKVMGSRDAATKLHSPAAMTDTFGVEGVESKTTNALLETLRKLKIGAHLGSNLESKMRHIINQLEPDRPHGLDSVAVVA
jgi:FAD binding domain